MINAFLKGLNNRNAAIATELMKPKSLEKAFNLIRKEDEKSDNNYIRTVINRVRKRFGNKLFEKKNFKS